MSKVAIVGTGYVGLVTGACFASLGHEVVGVDLDAGRLSKIEMGEVPFFEPGLEELVRSNIGVSLTVSTNLQEAVAAAEVTFIAVGTPEASDGRIDLSQVESAVKAVGSVLRDIDSWHVVVIKSTVVPGTTVDRIGPWLEEASGRRIGRDVGLAVNPEFLTEGTAVHDFMFPDRIVIGAADDRSGRQVVDLYESFEGALRIVTEPTTAEMIKYASNSLLSTLISFSNQIADIGAAIGGVDVVDVMRGVTSSRYMTIDGSQAPITSFIAAGCGFGGSCLPKDTSALALAGRDAGVTPSLLEAVMEVNAERPDRVLELIRRHFPDLADLKVSVLGLAFKPDTDDVRESPAFPVIRQLLEAEAIVTTHDPMVAQEALPADLAPQVSHQVELEAAVIGADAIVIITSWDEYLDVPETLTTLGASPLVIDGRRMLQPDSVTRYEGIGR